MDAQATATQAAQLIREHGWGHTFADRQKGRLCIRQALIAAHPSVQVENALCGFTITSVAPVVEMTWLDNPDAVAAACRAGNIKPVKCRHPEMELSVGLCGWNDRWDRTEKQVLDLLAAIADIYSGQKADWAVVQFILRD